MTLYTLIKKSLWFYRKQHITLLIGTIISTAVLTGALIIGDSVEYSLNQLVDIRLGNTRFAMQTGDRFVRADLAKDISEKIEESCLSMLMLPGIGVNPETDNRINSINILGIESGFGDFFNISFPNLENEEAIINENVAQKLGLQIGEELILRVENADVIPINAPFAQDSRQSVVFRLTVKVIAKDDQMGRFSLKSNQAAPFNVFVNLDFFSEKLNLSGHANTILVSDGNEGKLSQSELNEFLQESWQLADAGIKIKSPAGSEKIELLSNRIFIDDPVSDAIEKITIQKESILTYLVNSIRYNQKETPYSFITAASAPLVPETLKEDEIIVNDWLSDDLGVKIGDTISLGYFVIGPLRNLKEESKIFVVKSIIKTGEGGIYKSLMPEFPGLADAGSCRDWDTGIPIDLDKIRDKDEQYWDDYKGTPKALINIDTGKKIWGNNFGSYTAFRFDKELIDQEEIKKTILTNLKPNDINLTFRPVFEEGKNAASNSVDFGELFLSLSFFVIFAGVLLTALLFGLNTESRKEETGILSALGFSRKKILLMRFAESSMIAILGGVLGSGFGIIYNYGILAGLNSVWNEVVRTDMLVVHLQPLTLIIGAVSGILIAMIVIWLITKRKLKQAIVDLLKNTPSYSNALKKRKSRLNYLIMISGFGGSAILIVYSLINSIDLNSGLFLSAGALFISGAIAFLNHYLSRQNSIVSDNIFGLFKLSLKNTGRNKARSLTTITLLALGTFTIVITGANRKTFYGTDNNRQSGTGGFTYWAETSLPLIYDLNTLTGKSKYGLEEEKVLTDVDFVQLFSLDGDDASCLNLNQVQQPRILGIDPDRFNKKQMFSFAKLLKQVDKSNPWLELTHKYENNVIPAFADQTVITWGLKKKVGDTLLYQNEKGEMIKLLLVGGLNNSIFQGNILIAENQFRKHFPSVGGSKVMLIDAPASNKNKISELLQAQLKDLGFDLTPAPSRLAEFNSVTNTYLTVFMALGGLGVLIGTFGLGIVLLRNMLDRKQELALLLAMGYRKNQVFLLIFSENLFLLLAGLIIGILAALIGILPSLLSPSFTIPGNFMFLLIGVIFVSGVVWIWLPTKQLLKGDLMVGLRNE